MQTIVTDRHTDTVTQTWTSPQAIREIVQICLTIKTTDDGAFLRHYYIDYHLVKIALTSAGMGMVQRAMQVFFEGNLSSILVKFIISLTVYLTVYYYF